jgi:DNA polymerase-3 subunit gamma/tau
MTKQELHTKYRPTSFEEIYGQDHVTSVLQEYIKRDEVPHSMVFFGPPGCGKTSAARLIANSLNPSEYGLIEIDAARSGKIEDMRALELDIYSYAQEGTYKVYVIDEAHRISSAAFDSLLKTVEEPPEEVIFIFVTTNRDAIPNTILSRSDTHQFNRISNDKIKKRLDEILKLESLKLTDDLVHLAVEAGAGSLRDAIVALQRIIVMYENNETQVDIVKSLGIVGPKGLGDFCRAFLNNDLSGLRNASACFDPSIVDPVKAVHALQQFALDARHCIVDPSYVYLSESNVEEFVNSLNLQAEGMAEYIEGCLLFIYDMSLLLEEDFSKSTNHKGLITRFLIRLESRRA